ncbi:MAG: hypothetical protein JXL80_17615 [Planctomycetes bacterium]|nr:hypothetical protein [Planctomycetota bacterium]
MDHLNEDQIEAILSGREAAPRHVAECDECAAVLRGRQAVRRRLQAAFAIVAPPEGLAERLGERFARPRMAEVRQMRCRTHRVRLLWTVAAAAAVLAVMITLAARLFEGHSQAAIVEKLAEAHMTNLGRSGPDTGTVEPAAAAEFFRGKLGYAPLMPASGGTTIRHYGTVDIDGRPAANLLLETPDGPASVIVTAEPVGCLCGCDGATCADGHATCYCGCGTCNVAKVDRQGHSYCAVGEQPAERLGLLLASLGPVSPEQPVSQP